MNIFTTFIRGKEKNNGVRHVKTTGIGDRWLLATTITLAAIGILMVYDSSVAIALRDFANPYYFVREQVKWLCLGFLAFGVFSKLPYGIFRRFAVPLLIGTLALLLAVFIPGFGVRALGAHRWLNFGIFIVQPAELAKLTMVIYLAAWFSTKERGRLLAFLLLIGMVAGLVVIEPDLGTAVTILGTALALYFVSGAPVMHFAALIPVLLAAVGGLAVAQPYRLRRVLTFLNPDADPLGSSYQIRQVLLALGSGGLFGVGLGKSRQKYEYLPEANTDSIFAILGEETGFVGTTIVVLLFLFLVWRCFKIARRIDEPFGKMLVLGIGSWIGIQTFINIGSMVAVLPLTGVPLPLISYGGSNLVITLGALGIVYNVSKKVHE
ncbi:MAG: putative lipid II flippase FtsW [Patescibacteria group bacterium]